MKLPKQSENFPEWYNRVVLEAGLAENSAVRGCMVIKPYGYALWENMQSELNMMIKQMGVDNVYFPLLIPESFLKKEAEHVEGFAPEVAVVTQAGGKKLEEKFVIRPTSETVMYDTFSRWINSYRDLPLQVNQWANVMRWEMRTRLFLRTSEFLWQEGHTVHATEAEAKEMMMAALSMYEKFVRDYLAIYVIPGEKSALERFAGAEQTVSIEGLMRDGKALQMGTSHNLGQNFAKSFNIKFLDKDNNEKHPWQTSWGVSTRLIGGIIMSHGDDKGLILPPRVAPLQVVIIPIYKSENERKEVWNKIVDKLNEILQSSDIRFKIDDDEQNTPGWKFNHWEMKGVPFRIEVGPRDAAAGSFILVDRLSGEKETVLFTSEKQPEIVNFLKVKLNDFHNRLLERSQEFVQTHTYEVKNFSEILGLLEADKLGFFKTFWCGAEKCERELQANKVTIRVLPFSGKTKTGKCAVCNKDGQEILVAKAY